VLVVIAGPWMLGQLITWTQQLYAGIPGMVGG
jgi:flagellar biosynthesis protein FliQ